LYCVELLSQFRMLQTAWSVLASGSPWRGSRWIRSNTSMIATNPTTLASDIKYQCHKANSPRKIVRSIIEDLVLKSVDIYDPM
jgi:hypothetical protein